MFITLMRKHTKGILIKIMVGLIAVVFIFWGVYAIREKPGTKIAYVNGDLITGLEYEAQYREMLNALQKQYKEYWNDNLIKVFQLRQRALENLINKRLISQESHRIGLGVADDEIANAIFTYPAFQINGEFDEGRYKSLLRYNRMEPTDFETAIKLELLGQKIQNFIKCFFPITDAEIMDYYAFQKEKVNVEFVCFNPKDFKGKIEVSQDEKEAYFKENKEKYRIPEKIKIAYLVIDPSHFLDKVTVSEEEVSEFYELNQESFNDPKQVKVRHILLRLSPNTSESEDTKTKEKALSLLKRLKDGEDFAALAKKYSQGPTASKGGDLDYIKPGQMVKPFEDLAFSLKKGEIGGPVKTQFGWHIIKVDDIKEATKKTFSEVRDQIETTIKKDISKEIAHERALTLMDQMPYDINLATYAAQHGFKVKESEYFSKNGPIPGLGADERLTKSVYSLEKGEISEIIEHENKFYIIQIVENKKSHIPKMGEVSDQLQKDFINHLSLVAAKREAEAYLAELKGGADWVKMAKAKGLTTDETSFFTRREATPKIGHTPFLSEAIFSLSSKKRYPDEAFEVNNKVYLVRWLAKEEIKMTDFDKDKDSFQQMLLSQKQRRIFNVWLQSLKERAEIKIVTPIE